MNEEKKELVALAANTLRCLAADEVQKAKSGHPGVALGLADVAAVLWTEFLNASGKSANWCNRDRFVMSGGHGSSLLYALLHLSGYDLSLEDLKNFRQLGSKTPGHPEFGIVPGVETTTGPLGQGIANGVGMAIAERMLAERFNTEDLELVDHHTWVTCGDGDLEEGISHEAASLAGALGLNKLTLLYDSNTISIEGRVSITMTDITRRRFESYGWKVFECPGHDIAQIRLALRRATKAKQPTIIIFNTTIGKGAPNKQDSAGCHGSPLGDEEVRLLKQGVGFDPDKFFYVPDEVRKLFGSHTRRVDRKADAWEKKFRSACRANAALKAKWDAFYNDNLDNLAHALPEFDPAKTVSTRVASGKVLNAIAPAVPQLVGGSADLAPSNMTYLDGMGDIARDSFSGRNFHFGVREIGMAGVMNGIAQHGGLRIFGATFFVFCDYCRPVIRVSALMKTPAIFVLTHDSFYVGEDGPTHEPIEQLAAMRAMPNVCVFRPADATETAIAWQVALERRDGPTCLVLSRQNLPVIDRKAYPSVSMANKGAYILWQRNNDARPDAILIASGSEVSLALQVAQADGRNLRVVSMPSWDLFEKQSPQYRESIFPSSVTKRIAVEAASPFGWERYIGNKGITLTLNDFGASGPADKLAEHFGFTPAHLTRVLNDYLNA